MTLIKRHLPVFAGQQSRAQVKQLGKASGTGIAHSLRNLPYGQVRRGKQMLCLAHTAPLDIFRDRTAMELLKAGFELGCSHTGDF